MNMNPKMSLLLRPQRLSAVQVPSLPASRYDDIRYHQIWFAALMHRNTHAPVLYACGLPSYRSIDNHRQQQCHSVSPLCLRRVYRIYTIRCYTQQRLDGNIQTRDIQV